MTLPNNTDAAYGYDANGNLMQIRHTGPGATTISEVNHTYDAVNSRLTRTDTAATAAPASGTETMTYDAANELLTSNATAYGYDLNGNRNQKTEGADTTTYAYDDENRLIGVEITGSNPQVIAYAYDPFGRRIEKSVNGTITRYLYDGDDILLEYNSSGNVIARYIHGPGIDEPLAMEKNNQNYYYHADGLGSIVALTNSAGSVAQTYQYDAVGNLMNYTPAITQPYTYTAREYDPETGLYFYRARHYDPLAGRFLQRDPIGFAGGDVNLYAYAYNNPINFSDPSGRFSPTIIGGAAGGIIGGFTAGAIVGVLSSLNKPDTSMRDIAMSAVISGGVGAIAGGIAGAAIGAGIPGGMGVTQDFFWAMSITLSPGEITALHPPIWGTIAGLIADIFINPDPAHGAKKGSSCK